MENSRRVSFVQCGAENKVNFGSEEPTGDIRLGESSECWEGKAHVVLSP